MSEQHHSDTPEFGLRHRLALALEVAGLKPEDMAKELGLGVTTIRNYLKGRTFPTRAVLTAWALRCSISRDWLEYGIPASPSPSPQEGGPISGESGSACTRYPLVSPDGGSPLDVLDVTERKVPA